MNFNSENNINKKRIEEKLTTNYLGRRIVCLDIADSTNNVAKQLALQDAENGTLVICKKQTAGRGRRGRSWLSNDSDTLCMSILIYEKNTVFAPRYAVATAVAVASALREFGVDCQIKWPNDILVNNKKICGILLEGVTCGSDISSIICGIGVNVNSVVDDESVKDIATSVFSCTGKKFYREHIAAAILNSAESCFALCNTSDTYKGLLLKYEKMSCIKGRAVVIKANEDICGTVEGFDDLGRIIINSEKGRIVFDSGDVSLRC